MATIAPLIEQRLAPEQARTLKRVSEAAGRHSVKLYLVGGTVRDLMLGRPSIDLDLSAVGLTPGVMLALAADMGAEVAASSQFGTYKLRLGQTVIDVATARKESYAYSGALPLVEPGTLREDLTRRDFSINAMAASLSSASWGDLLDPFSGQRDLQHGLIRVLHPASFIDDATRTMRAVRYAGRLGFQIEGFTKHLLRRHLRYLDTIKGERVRHELQRIFREERAAEILGLAQELGLLSAIYAPLRLDDGTLSKLRRVLEEPYSEPELAYLSLLAYALPAEHHPGLVSRLSMDSRWTRVVLDIGQVKDKLPALQAPDMRRSQIYHLLRPYDKNAIYGCAIASDAPLAAERLRLYLSELRHVKPALNGDDLMSLGMREGPAIGRLLRELLDARLDRLVSSRQDEMALARRRIRESA